MNEFQLIETFVAAFDAPPPPYGPGDDCAVLPAAPGALCVTTDALVEDVHFTRRTFSFEDVGHKALAVNLSDLAAMGAAPAWALCALGLPDDVGAREVRRLAAGMSALARVHGVKLVGGNVTRARRLSVTLTVGGRPPRRRRPLLRSGARAGDVVYASGTLGDAAAGLHLLSTRRARGFAALTLAQRRPSPHLAWALAAAPWATAAIDVSDGLLQDAGHLARASGVGVDVSTAALPLSEALRDAVPAHVARHYALSGGEDYVVLATVPRRRARAFEAAMSRARFEVYRVGVMTTAPGVRVDGLLARGTRGFQHRR